MGWDTSLGSAGTPGSRGRTRSLPQPACRAPPWAARALLRVEGGSRMVPQRGLSPPHQPLFLPLFPGKGCSPAHTIQPWCRPNAGLRLLAREGLGWVVPIRPPGEGGGTVSPGGGGPRRGRGDSFGPAQGGLFWLENAHHFPFLTSIFGSPGTPPWVGSCRSDLPGLKKKPDCPPPKVVWRSEETGRGGADPPAIRCHATRLQLCWATGGFPPSTVTTNGPVG